MSQSSPRPSLDGHSTPFLHNLTQRLRKGSSAASSPTDIRPPTPVDPLSKTETSRAARRMILSMVRDDWEWPSNISTTSSPNDPSRSPIPHRDPISYRLREEAQSDLEAEDSHHKRRSKSDPYKFESPDTVGDVIAERRRKRKKMAEEEMTWNEGLRTWQQRRDAWTSALQHKPISNKPTERRPSTNMKRPSYKSRLSNVFVRDKAPSGESKGHSHSHSLSTDGGSTSWPASPTSPTPECSSIDSMEAASPGVTTRTTTNTTVEPNTPLTPSSTVMPCPTTVPATPSNEPGPWLPIYPPILPSDDIVRDRIKPAAYPTIYSKIVVQGLSPNVPIPLSHMIPALVEGWKSEGNWPPQPTSVLAADVKKGHKSSTFAKWRKEHSSFHHSHSRGNSQNSNEIIVAGHPASPANKSKTNDDDDSSRHGLRRSIGMMRKVGSFLGGAISSSTDGLDDLGIEFNDKDEAEMARNMALNKGLAH